jgi:DNA damage-inducible protein 1
MLKAHQACIDLQKGVLRIQDREVRFLSEHELPEKARDPPERGDIPGGSSNQPIRQAIASAAARRAQPVRRPSQAPAAGSPSHSERDISFLMDLGVTREIAISTLDAANGDVDVAASLLF